jgi:hypothetical protein
MNAKQRSVQKDQEHQPERTPALPSEFGKTLEAYRALEGM